MFCYLLRIARALNPEGNKKQNKNKKWESRFVLSDTGEKQEKLCLSDFFQHATSKKKKTWKGSAQSLTKQLEREKKKPIVHSLLSEMCRPIVFSFFLLFTHTVAAVSCFGGSVAFFFYHHYEFLSGLRSFSKAPFLLVKETVAHQCFFFFLLALANSVQVIPQQVFIGSFFFLCVCFYFSFIYLYCKYINQ